VVGQGKLLTQSHFLKKIDTTKGRNKKGRREERVGGKI